MDYTISYHFLLMFFSQLHNISSERMDSYLIIAIFIIVIAAAIIAYVYRGKLAAILSGIKIGGIGDESSPILTECSPLEAELLNAKAKINTLQEELKNAKGQKLLAATALSDIKNVAGQNNTVAGTLDDIKTGKINESINKIKTLIAQGLSIEKTRNEMSSKAIDSLNQIVDLQRQLEDGKKERKKLEEDLNDAERRIKAAERRLEEANKKYAEQVQIKDKVYQDDITNLRLARETEKQMLKVSNNLVNKKDQEITSLQNQLNQYRNESAMNISKHKELLSQLRKNMGEHNNKVENMQKLLVEMESELGNIKEINKAQSITLGNFSLMAQNIVKESSEYVPNEMITRFREVFKQLNKDIPSSYNEIIKSTNNITLKLIDEIKRYKDKINSLEEEIMKINVANEGLNKKLSDYLLEIERLRNENLNLINNNDYDIKIKENAKHIENLNKELEKLTNEYKQVLISKKETNDILDHTKQELKKMEIDNNDKLKQIEEKYAQNQAMFQAQMMGYLKQIYDVAVV